MRYIICLCTGNPLMLTSRYNFEVSPKYFESACIITKIIIIIIT